MKSLCVVFAVALCATAAVADMLPQGAYAQHDEGGDHVATSWVGGYIVAFDGQLFVWNGSVYTNGLCELEFIEILGGEYGWVLICPHGVDTGIVTGAR
ncbi:MAG TPA: hypothetical protein VFY93_07940 [Planctomycetota bacterium]|nr:hypothetical protein [Planctomycetota bacterium]